MAQRDRRGKSYGIGWPAHILEGSRECLVFAVLCERRQLPQYLATWNSPVLISLSPVISMIAAGSAVVCMFALAVNDLNPSGLQGYLERRPLVALATLTLTSATHGKLYAAIAARSMIARSR
jgi:hypothetical protein